MEYALEVKDLCKNYGAFQLDHVSFSLPRGSIMGLIGENGAGKSTTIKAILNLIQPDSGQICVLGMDHRKEEAAIKEQLGVVLDESTFHDMLTVENVETILKRIYKNWDSPLFGSYVQRFGLPAGKVIKEFSRGMKMKLSIAAALAAKPSLLILDEATSGLDPVVRNEILDEFLNFIQDENHAILISSHITSDLEKVADYITYLHQGKVVLSGEKDSLLEDYGRIACSRSELERMDKKYIIGARTSQFGCEAIVKNRSEVSFLYPNISIDPTTLEEIMVYTVKGDEQR